MGHRCSGQCRVAFAATAIDVAVLQVYVDRLSSNVQVVRRNSNSCRRITLYGSDGSLRTFLVQSSQVKQRCDKAATWAASLPAASPKQGVT